MSPNRPLANFTLKRLLDAMRNLAPEEGYIDHVEKIDLLYEEASHRDQLIANAPDMLVALQMAYRKHHLGDDTIGWNELSEKLMNVLCETMGDAAFVAWMTEVTP